MAKKKRRRLDDRLLADGYFDDLRTARGFVMAGKVLVDDKVVAQPGTAVTDAARIAVRGGVAPYASRGGLKLAAALDHFGIDVAGRVVLDAGASTGGFTDCLLGRGARRVYAVDVGYGQLRGRLAVDPRVVNRERTNISDVKPEELDPPIELAVCDLSNLSLVKAVPILAALFVRPEDVHIVALVKPLFEGLPRDRMRDPDALQRVVEALTRKLEGDGFRCRSTIPSPIEGGRQSVEFLAEIVGADDGR